MSLAVVVMLDQKKQWAASSPRPARAAQGRQASLALFFAQHFFGYKDLVRAIVSVFYSMESISDFPTLGALKAGAAADRGSGYGLGEASCPLLPCQEFAIVGEGNLRSIGNNFANCLARKSKHDMRWVVIIRAKSPDGKAASKRWWLE